MTLDGAPIDITFSEHDKRSFLLVTNLKTKYYFEFLYENNAFNYKKPKDFMKLDD